MNNFNQTPEYCGECAFFNRNTCYHRDLRTGQGHYGVTKYTPACLDIRDGRGYLKEELWNRECRELIRQGRYDSDDYLRYRSYEI